MSNLNTPFTDRPAEWGTMEPVSYKGFVIDKYMNITINGNPIFTARWQTCWSLQEAKDLIDASLAAKALPSLSNYSPMVLLSHDEQMDRDWQAMEEKLNQHFDIDNQGR